MSSAPKSRDSGILSVILYALPALPLATLQFPLFILVPTYYSEGLGLPLAAVGAALLAVRLFDAVSDPVVGVLADRWQPRFGRRRLWLLASAPLTALTSYMLFVPGDSASIAYLLTWGILASIASTASLVPFNAWGAELSTDYHGRSRIAGAREGLIVTGTLLAAGVPAILAQNDIGLALSWIALTVVLLLPTTAIAAVLFVPEPKDRSKQRVRLREGLGHIRRNRPFLRLIAAFAINGLANGFPATLFLFFVGRVLATPEWQGGLLFLYFLCGIAGIPLWLAASRRLGKHRAWSFAMIGACAVFAFVPALGPGDLTAFIIICVLTGFAVGADLVLPASIQADVVDLDTASSGTQRTALYFALWGLATKVALAAAVGIAFPLLQAFGFQPDDKSATDGLFALAVLYAWVPVALKLGAIALMWRFPLDQKEQERLARQIDANS
ncbi:MFS transporter [Amorphus orientalis]|uniref:Na+/melibiose symporter-like transporter n=1 Tax=Amorphus orientalis TaxID=649198 RepID=A0AAE3VR57_9HYPH|nr:MFS transporter [Amorphus orientalis]MDQ0316330.1 Na+/melibiose symporter-like transporter [Amorphus orientalis]